MFGSQYGGSQAGMQEEAIVDEDGTVFYDSVEAELHPDASADGGVLCTDETVMERQKSAVVDIMKSLGKKLLTGKFDLLKISLPVKIFEARSYLQKLCDPLAFPRIMNRAVTASSPEERLKWVVAYFVAGYHRAFLTWSKPFNPILGETWYARLPDGTEACMEQISHHPPVSAFQIIGPGKSYYFHGHSQPTVTYKTNGITSYAVGERQVEFLDGSVIDVSFPEYNVRNIVSSSTTRADISGKVDFIDKENGLIASLQIGKLYGETGLLGRPDAVSGTLYRTVGDGHAGQVSRAVSGKIASGRRHGGGSSRLRSTSSNAILTHDPKTGHAYCGSDVFTPVATCRGNWLAYLDWDGDRYWTWATDRAEEWTESHHIPNVPVLPSDCSCRDDLRLLAEGDFAGSQEAKDRMENDQRRDAKNRPVPT